MINVSNNKKQDRISPYSETEQTEYKDKRKINTYSKSLKRYYFFKCRSHSAPTPLNLAYLGDALILEAQLFLLEKVSHSLGLKVKRRIDITDWQSRKSPKVRIGKYTYYLLSS